MSNTAPGISSNSRRTACVACLVTLTVFSAGCGSLPRIRSPFGGSTAATDRNFGRTDADPLRERRALRDKPTDDPDSLVRDERTEKLIKSQISHLSAQRQREIRDSLRDVPSKDVPHILRAMRTRGLLAEASPESSSDGRLSADEYGDRFRDDPRVGHSGSRNRLDVSPVGHGRSDFRDTGQRDGYGTDDRRTGYRGSDSRPESQDPQGSNNRGLGRSILDNMRNLTGRSNSEPRTGGLLDNVLPGRTGSSPPPKPDDKPADKPAETLATEWDESLKRLIAITDARTSKLGNPNEKNELEYIRNHVYLRMLYLMAGKQEHAVAHIPRISPADQEFWQHTLWGMTDYFREDVLSSRGNRATQTVSHFRTAVTKLREQADLEVRNLVFCRKITSFGNYDTVPMKELRYEFRAGESVLIYAEIDNFKSELTEDDRYRTRLKSTIEIYSDSPAGAGNALMTLDFAPTKDLCRSQRRDYFHSYIVTIPDKLGLGDYKLKLTIQDEVAGKMATETVRFRIN